MDRFEGFEYAPQGHETMKHDYGVPSRNTATNPTGKKAPEWT